MEIKIICYEGSYSVHVNGTPIGIWSYYEGAITAARKEIEARYPIFEVKE